MQIKRNLISTVHNSFIWIDSLYDGLPSVVSKRGSKEQNQRDQESSKEIELSPLALAAVLRTPSTIYFPITSDIKHTRNHCDARVWRGTSLSLFSLDRSNRGMKITFSFFDKITNRIWCFSCVPATDPLVWRSSWSETPSLLTHSCSRKCSILLQIR